MVDATRTMNEVYTEQAPVNDFPYSQGIVHGETVYIAGQLPVDPESGEIVGADIQTQTRRAMENIAAILEAAGSSTDDIVKTTAFLNDLDDFDDFNEVYRSFLSEPYPARSAIEVGDLAQGVTIEIEVIAAV